METLTEVLQMILFSKQFSIKCCHEFVLKSLSAFVNSRYFLNKYIVKEPMLQRIQKNKYTNRLILDNMNIFH